jgi:hypothetical protein
MFLDSVLDQCFLRISRVVTSLQQVLQMCMKLCQLLRRIDAEAMQDELFLH